VSHWGLAGVAALGAFHGLNPAMGWLFATAIGLQERSRRALLVAIGPLALGHLVSIGLVVLLVEELRVVASDRAIKIGAAVVLLLFAIWKIYGRGHPRWVGMRLTMRELVVWSFLMASAHGAGLMLAPFLLASDGGSEHAGHEHGVAHTGGGESAVSGLLDSGGAIAIHTLAMAAVAACMALLVYEVVGVRILRRGWLNLDRVWALALVAGAFATLFVA
jgi:hypothetical protein